MPLAENRELHDWAIPQGAALWQFGVKSPSREIEVPPLQLSIELGPDAVFDGRYARADGVLGTPEFSALGRICQEFQRRGCPHDNAVPFNLGALSRAITGHKSGTQRKILRDALDTLMTTLVRIPGFNPTTQRIEGSIEFRGTLLAGVVMQSLWEEYETVVRLADSAELRHDGDAAEHHRRRARQLSGSMRGEETMIAILPQWMGDRIRQFGGLVLDAETHRALRRNHRNVALALEGLPWVADEGCERETAVVDLTVFVYESLGLRYSVIGECRRVLDRALHRILEVDASYDTLEIRPHATRRRLNQLLAIRYTGALKQKRLRDRARGRV